MNSPVNFEFYINVHMGKLSELEFNRQLPFAMKTFNNATYNQVKEWNDDFRHCVCGLIDIKHEAQEQGSIVSTSDGITSYSFDRNTTTESKINAVLNVWLAGHHNLTYSGARR